MLTTHAEVVAHAEHLLHEVGGELRGLLVQLFLDASHGLGDFVHARLSLADYLLEGDIFTRGSRARSLLGNLHTKNEESSEIMLKWFSNESYFSVDFVHAKLSLTDNFL